MRVASDLIIVLILINILTAVRVSVPSYGRLFEAVGLVSLVVFTLEYVLRI